MKRRSMTLLLAGLLVCSSVFTGYSAKAEAAETYVTEAVLQDNATAAPAADDVVPDANQYEYQKQELAAFCHFGPNTFNGVEWGESYGDRAPSDIFTLTENFDADTLVRTLKEAGFQKLIVTAKHHDGFCIWNSAETTYDVESTTYATYNYDNMGGDILAEMSAACTEYDMDMGLYLSPWDIHEPSYGYYDENGNATTAENDALDYNEHYNKQLIEILSNDKYGNNGHFNEVWMDGAKGSGANAQEYDFVKWFTTIQKYEGKDAVKIVDGEEVSYGYQADCMLFGAQAYTTVRWIGNELGYANEETWAKSTVNYDSNTINSNSSNGYTIGFENGNKWTVPEADCRITSGWFWGTAKSTPKSITDLGNMYFGSVGHNSVLLLNVPPNNQGTVDQAILDRVVEFGNEVKETFADNLAEDAEISATEVRGNDTAYKPSNVIDGDDATYWTTNDGTTTGSMIIDLGSAKTFDVVSIEEAIQFGQRITSFKVEYRNGDSAEWKTFDEGTTVGAKRLSRKAPVKADQLKITVSTASTVIENPNVPMISEVGVYKASTGFELAGAAPEGMDVIDIQDSEFTLSSGWTSETGSQFINNTNVWANGDTNGTVTATLDFTGSKVYLLGTMDPNHGTADIYIDDVKVATINTNATSRALGQTIFESDTLADGEHTLKLVATETGKAIGLEAAYVISNGGLGMIGIEENAYTMNEEETIEVKLVRVGGSTGKATVTLTPNPGSAVQGDFDTDLIHEITFEDGETEKTATVRTKRNEKVTGDQYFTIELESGTENLILGYNTKAKITILDEESKVPEPEKEIFVFPSEADTTVTLEAESLELHNTGENENWPMQVSDKDWASGGKILNAMNSGDSAVLYYNAPVPGKYKVVVTYRSGASANGFSWSEADGKITAGSVTMGANDSAGATHTGEIEFEVVTAGTGVLTFLAGSANAPQLDKFDITLVEAYEVPVEESAVIRLYGADRYGTSFAVAEEYQKVLDVEEFDAVIVATGKKAADALSGSYLAAQKKAPILLTEPGKEASLIEYVKENLKAGGMVYLLGGTGVVSEELETDLGALGYSVKRLKGTDRYGTNLAILEEAGITGNDLLVATGEKEYDSLSASATNKPILLVNTEITDAQKEVLEGLPEGNKIWILGGTGAVSEDIEAELKAYSNDVVRVKGTDRYATSVEIAKTFFGEDPEKVTMAYGEKFPDGLCGGPLAAEIGAPVLLVKAGGTDLAAAYTANAASGYVFGGTGVIADETVKAVLGEDIEIVSQKYE